MKRLFFGATVFTLSFLAFINLSSDIIRKVQWTLDNKLLTFFYTHRTPVLTTVMKSISMFGFEIPIVLGVAIFIVALIRKYRKEAFVFALVVGMAPVIDGILKRVIQRPRPPFFPLVSAGSYSFPSGHALTSFVFYATLTYFIYYFTKNKRLTAISAICFSLLILLIGISRIYLGVHYPTDVLTGWLIGLCWLSGVFLVIYRHGRRSRIGEGNKIFR